MKLFLPIRTLLLVLATLLLVEASTASAQSALPATPPAKIAGPARRVRPRTYQPPFNSETIVLDPGHGGADAGAILGATGEEKTFNLAFAQRLATLLTAKGFTVVMTHPDADADVPADQRIESANRARAGACLLLHASSTGHGVHLFTSALTPPALTLPGRQDASIAPWDSAQSASLPRSLQLANEIATALNGKLIPLVVGRVSIAPIDSLECPAVALEIAPASGKAGEADADYQQQIAESLVTALTFWRQRAETQIAAERAAFAPAAAAPAQPSARPKLKPKPIIVPSPEEVPLSLGKDTPAPVIRRPSTQTPPGGAL